jgi:serine/threonine protein kinase
METPAHFSLTLAASMTAPSRSATDPKQRRARKSPPSHSDGRSALEGRAVGARTSPTHSGERPRELPASDPDRLLGRTLASKYRLDSLLGEGAMGRIYQAHHQLLDKDVAIKVLHQHLGGEDRVAKRFHREARAASRLSHPNSVQILDFGSTDDGVLYIAMELLDGEDLQVILDHDFPLTPRRIVSILGQALRALDEAHHVGIIHRDLKPENIVVLTDRAGRDLVKVCDFGIAKIMEGEGQSITVDGFVCGTPQYMAPEQARGEDVDRRLDIYAAGVVLYQMLTGSPPFSGDTALGIITKHLTDEAVPPRKRRPELGIPESLERIAKKAMSKSRNDRFATAKEMSDALEAAIDELGPLADERLGEGRLAEQASKEAELARGRTEEALAKSDRPSAGSDGGAATSSSVALPVQRVPWGMVATGVAMIALVAAAWSLVRPAPAPTTSQPITADVHEVRTTAAPPVTSEPIVAPPATTEPTPPPTEPVIAPPSTTAEPTPPATTATSEASSPRRPLTSAGGRVTPFGTRSGGSAASVAPQPPVTSAVGATPSAAATQQVPEPALSPARRAFEAGRSAFLAQDFRGAIRSFEEAARLSPSDADVQKQLGRAYMRAGDIPRGVAAYRRYLELAPAATDRAVIESIISQHQ